MAPALGALIALAVSGEAQEASSALTVRQLFSNPSVTSPALSDDGQTVAVIVSKGDLQFIFTRPLAGGAMKAVAKLDDPDIRLNWLEWANSKRLLMSVHARNPNGVGMRSRVTRLYGVDADGKNFGWLGKRWPYLGQMKLQPFYQDQIVHWTPDDPDYLLIQFDSPYRDEWPRVQKMNVQTGALRPHQGAKSMVREWLADKAGDIRAGIAYREDKYYELWTRVDPEADFELTIRKEAFSHEEEFLGFSAEDPGKIYVNRDLDGRTAIYEYDLRAKKLGELVYAHPEVDVDGLFRSPAGDWRVLGIRYTTDSPQIHFLDEAAERERAALHRAFEQEFGQAVQIYPRSYSKDGNRQILHVSADTQPPTYFAYDRKLKQLFPLIDERPDIRREQLSETKRVTYQARDGLAIPAYLTLPRGHEAKDCRSSC